MSESKMREAFETWWPSVGQTIGKVAAWEAWQAATHEALAQPANVVELTDEQIEQIYYEACREFANTRGLRAVADAAVAAYKADHLPDAEKMVEPFGYFRAEPFGWTDCNSDDEGAIPLYTQPFHIGDTNEMVVPEGYALVPVRPTENMVNAANAIIGRRSIWKHTEAYASEVYEVMLAASTNKEPK